MSYFFLREFFHYHFPVFFFRKNRPFLRDLFNIGFFSVGDYLEVTFQKESLSFVFGGVCLSIRGKRLISPRTSVLLRGYIQRFGSECIFCLFSNRFSLSSNDYKRKFFFNRRSKLFYYRSV